MPDETDPPIFRLSASHRNDGGQVTWVTARIEMEIGGLPVRLEIAVPKEPVALVEVLPVFRGFVDVVTAVAEARVQAEGRRISCQVGCGACCRQPVPIGPAEVGALRRLVDSFPEPRRSEIRGRFAAARHRLELAGLAEWFEQPPVVESGVRRAKALEYFREGIACPFLENELCSIHADRPVACREYLVTSDARRCAAPTPGEIEIVALPARISDRLGAMERPLAGRAGWRALALALTGDDETVEAERRPGPAWIEDFFRLREGPK